MSYLPLSNLRQPEFPAHNNESTVQHQFLKWGWYRILVLMHIGYNYLFIIVPNVIWLNHLRDILLLISKLVLMALERLSKLFKELS